MLIFPAIDIYDGAAVRLYQGDYRQMTVYEKDPLVLTARFAAAGATCLHLVDLQGAKEGRPQNLPIITRLAQESGMFVEVGGGIRSMETVERYLSAGVSRVILGTAAVRDPALLEQALARYGEKIAVGVDMKDGRVALSGWLEETALEGEDFCRRLEERGVSAVICTDIARDGALGGSNLTLYRRLAEQLRHLRVIASGGVSSLAEIAKLARAGVHGAIIGKAYYTGALDLAAAIETAKGGAQ